MPTIIPATSNVTTFSDDQSRAMHMIGMQLMGDGVYFQKRFSIEQKREILVMLIDMSRNLDGSELRVVAIVPEEINTNQYLLAKKAENGELFYEIPDPEEVITVHKADSDDLSKAQVDVIVFLHRDDGEGWDIWLNGIKLNLEMSLKIVNHSPTGFNIGYAGSGPAQSALAICVARFGVEAGRKAYQKFKHDNLTDPAFSRAKKVVFEINLVRWYRESFYHARSAENE